MSERGIPTASDTRENLVRTVRDLKVERDYLLGLLNRVHQDVSIEMTHGLVLEIEDVIRHG